MKKITTLLCALVLAIGANAIPPVRRAAAPVQPVNKAPQEQSDYDTDEDFYASFSLEQMVPLSTEGYVGTYNGYKYFDVVVNNGSEYAELLFFADHEDETIGIPVGTYSVSADNTAFTLQNGEVMQDDEGWFYNPSFAATLNYGSYIAKGFLITDGTAEVKNVDGKLYIEVSGVNSYNRTVQITIGNPPSSCPQSGLCGAHLTWNLSCDGVLTISGNGDMANWSSLSNIPWYAKRESLVSVVIENGVTSIGSRAFENCSSLTSVTIGNSVTSIGKFVFDLCYSLTAIDVATDNPDYCSEEGVLFNKNKTTIVQYPSGKQQDIYTIPNSVTSIGNGAFVYCTALTSVIIPNSVTHIEDEAFFGCSGLTSIEIPNSVVSIGERAFKSCNNLTSVTCTAVTPPALGNAFSDYSIPLYVPCTSKETYRNADGWSEFTDIRSIEEDCNETPDHCSTASGTCGDDMTWDLSCDGVLTISGTGEMENYDNPYNNFDYTVYSIAPWREYTDLITSVIIKDGVTSIGSYAFESCQNVTYVEIPEGVDNIGQFAFSLCTSLTNIVLPNSLRYINDQAFSFSGLTTLWIPDGVYIIGDRAFAACYLSDVYIGNSVYKIGSGAFAECPNIYISIGSENTTYDNREWCNAIIETATNTLIQGFNNTFFIPSTITSIGYGAFDCTNPEMITCQAVTPPSYGGDGWCGLDKSIPLYVPCASKEAYRNAEGWAAFTDIRSIEEDCNETPECSLASGTCGDNLTWVLSCDGVLTVRGNGAMTDWSSETEVPWYDHKESIVSVMTEDGVTSIGSYAFYNYNSLKTLMLSNSMKLIAGYAISLCYNLEEINVDADNPVWSSLDGVLFNKDQTQLLKYPIGKQGAYAIPNSITSIGETAFYNCSGLTSVEIPNSVTSIGSGAFYNCSSLTSTIIPNSVTSIGEVAFYGCTSLTEVTIPENVTSIGTGATFQECTALTTVHWNAKNCTIESYDEDGNYYPPFLNLQNITTFTFGQNVETIPNYLCYGLSGLTSIEIPNSVTSIGERAFKDCSSLTSVTIPNSVTNIGEGAFLSCTSLTEVTIPESVATIGTGGTFQECTALTTVHWNAKNCTLQSYNEDGGYYPPFYNLQNITTFTFGQSVETIPVFLCDGLSGLTSVTIPANVKSIGAYAFGNCSGLTSIISKAITPPSMSQNTFEGVSLSIPVTVPCGAVTAYQAHTLWSQFTDIASDGGSFAFKVNLTAQPSGAGTVAITTPFDCYTNTGVITATPAKSCQFAGWADGASDGPVRTVTVTSDTSFTAIFEAVYVVNVTSNNEQAGSVTGGGTFRYGEQTVLNATANDGYHFIQWSDGNTDNPRTVTVTENKTYTAVFVASGECGDNLTWQYENGILTIIGTGAMYNFATAADVPWAAYVEYITSIILPEGLTTIGTNAFNGCSHVSVIHIPQSLKVSGNDSFYGCIGLTEVHIDNMAAWMEIEFGNKYSNPSFYAHKLYLNGKLVTSISVPTDKDVSLTFVGCTFDAIEIEDLFSYSSGTGSSNDSDVPHITAPNIYWHGELLDSLFIPEGVPSVQNHVFEEATCIKFVSFPTSLLSIGLDAFKGCVNIQEMKVNAVEPPAVNETAFDGISREIVVTVPCGSLEKYLAAPVWSEFNNISTPPSYYPEESDAVYQNEEYLWQGKTLPTDEIGTFDYTEHLYTVEGCDSVLTLHLTVKMPVLSDIVLEDNEDADYYTQFAETYNGHTVNTATLNRQFAQGRWSTLCLPFNVNKGMMMALGLYNRVFEFRYAQQADDNTMQIYFAPAPSIEAGKGYIVNANAKLATKTSFVFPNVTIDADADNGDISTLTGYNDGTGRGSLYLVGTLRTGMLQGTTSGNSYLGLKDNKLYYPNTATGTSIRAYRGFFRSEKPMTAQKVRIIAEGEEIGELIIDNGQLSEDAVKYIENGILYIERNGIRYDAQGQRIE